ncbi:MAG: ROK family protein [Gammaproteobacteria bacterium]
MTATKLLAGVELGGTKCVCVLGTGPGDIRARQRVPTTDPAATLTEIESVLSGWIATHGAFAAVGLASFGPLELDLRAPDYGYITATPKPAWSHTRVAGWFADRFGVPVGFDTDVNGAAIAEGRWGAAQGLANFAYVTVGTGIGAGLVVDGKTIRGCGHTEMGHIRVVRQRGDSWPGSCTFHGDCLEGLASGTAIQARAGVSAESLAEDDPVWDGVVHALAQLLHTMVLTTAPERIIIGGGVIESRKSLLGRIRTGLVRSLNGYVKAEEIVKELEHYVVLPALGSSAGSFGALALAENALKSSK